MAVQSPEVAGLVKPPVVAIDLRTQRHLNNIIANAASITGSDKHREGFDKSFDQTFGAGKFRISTKGGDDLDFTSEVEIAIHREEERLAEESYAHFQETMHEFQETMESFFAPDEFDYIYEDNYPVRYEINPFTGTFDLSDPDTFEYVQAAEVEYDEDGNPVGINSQFSCMRLGSHEDGTLTQGQLLLNAKEAMEDPIDLTNETELAAVQEATLHEEEGYIDYKGACVDPKSVSGQKVTLAQAELAKDPTIAASAAPAADAAGPEAETSAVGPNAQGNDLAAVAQAMGVEPAPAAPAVDVAVDIPAMKVAEAAPDTPVYKQAAAAPAAPAF